MNVCCINICPAEMQKHGQRCAGLIELTAGALSDDAVTLMLVAVQRDNLELSIKHAVKWLVLTHGRTKTGSMKSHYRTHRGFEQGNGSTEAVIRSCIIAFPSLFVSCNTIVRFVICC